jgi:hypothetical protein
MHIQEFAENSVDFAHFEPLHGNMMIPWTPYSVPGIKIQHTAAWVLGTESEGKHIAHFKDHAVLKIFGRTLPRTEANADITFVGAFPFAAVDHDGCGRPGRDALVFLWLLWQAPLALCTYTS